MTARVVTPWMMGSGGGKDDGQDGAPRCSWRVWVERKDGSYELAGTFAGTESEVMACALYETGAELGFALRRNELSLAEEPTSPGVAATTRGATPGGKS